ncbi:unnamed protein product [Acanthoscelides obtectus]|uniref:Cilia- and flagella-associated protein 157 n=3 Tax=Acanthoscelides obtectus TaxID=200917 RepID=A0A9P0PM87_ACAOB|nr:unnamed protein product [Acanthoscelides obtectus]CAK1668738.1 Cilia- and flagella-associated protein 157 [Acanthoscelides obtectus]
MAKGKGKKGGGKKKKVEVNPDALTEVDKTFYELTITDLNRKLARLRSLTQELEQKNEELKTENSKMDEDRNDIIIYLKRVLQEKTDEIAELEERIVALQETRQAEIAKYEEKIEEMGAEYKTMHEQLTSENKLLEGKLNSLEEFRQQRDELMKKFENQEEEMEKQEKRHKRELYEIERKFILSKDQLKRDMENKLMQLSTEFHDATELRIAATTHRVIRENIAVNNELDLLLLNQQRLFNENVTIKKRDATLRQEAELHESEKKKALGKVKVQLRLINKLIEDQSFLKNQIQQLKRYEAEVREVHSDKKKLDLIIQNLRHNKRILEQNLHNVRCNRTSIETDYLYCKEENDRLNGILQEAVSAIKNALAISSEGDESLVAYHRENFLNSLFTLLSKAKEEKIRRPSMETVDSIEATYARGDLGFVPKPVELRTSVKTYRHMDAQTGASFQEYLNTGKVSTYKAQYSLSDSVEGSKESIHSDECVEEEQRSSCLFFDETEMEETGSSDEFDIFDYDEGEGAEGATEGAATEGEEGEGKKKKRRKSKPSTAPTGEGQASERPSDVTVPPVALTQAEKPQE